MKDKISCGEAVKCLEELNKLDKFVGNYS